MAHELARLAARLYNSPLMVLPATAEMIAANLGERVAGMKPLAPRADLADGDGPGDGELYQVRDGTATIAVRGELVNRGSWLSSASGLTSYEGLRSAFRAAAADPRVERVTLDIDSPGGEAAGAMETGDELRALSRLKPVTAYVNSLAASAAYAIAAAAKEIVVTPSASVGSIGVVMLHMDRSEQMASQGMKPTLIHAGAFKVDGSPYAGLDDPMRSRLQAQVDDVYDLFTASVGSHRPKLGQDGARQTEAAMFMGRKAITAGVADRIGDIASDARRAAAQRARNPFAAAAKGEKLMIDDPTIISDNHQEKEKAAMADAQALEAARQDGMKDGGETERARIKQILDADAAKGKPSLARHLALATDLAPEAAVAALAAAADEAPAVRRMDAVLRPNLTASPAPAPTPAEDADAMWSGVVAGLNKR